MNCCPKCGRKVSESDKFCTNCGTKLSNREFDIKEYSQNDDSKERINKPFVFIIISLLIFIILLNIYCDSKKETEIISDTTPIEKVKEKEKKKDFKNYLVYKQSEQGIYVFKIQKNEFQKDDFVKYAEQLPKSPTGNTSFVFVFDKEVQTSAIDGMVITPPYNIPMYTTNVLWKQYPYFYYSDAFGIKQSYCEINGLDQKYYERNQALLYNETDFSHKYNLTAPRGFGLSSLNGCNPEYTADSYTIGQEMTLVTMASMRDNDIDKPISPDSDNSYDTNTTFQSNSSEFKPYMDDVEKRIKMNWTPPNINEFSKVTVIFTVSKTGHLIGEPKLKNSSGIYNFNESCINAIKLAAPFKPLPEEITQDTIDIEFTFDYKVR